MSLKFTDFTHYQLRRSISEISDRSFSSSSSDYSARRQNLINYGYFTPRRNSYRYLNRHFFEDNDTDSVFSESSDLMTTPTRTRIHRNASRKSKRTESASTEPRSVRLSRRKGKVLFDESQKSLNESDSKTVEYPDSDDNLQLMYEKIVHLESLTELHQVRPDANENAEEKMACSSSDCTDDIGPSPPESDSHPKKEVTGSNAPFLTKEQIKSDYDIFSTMAEDVARKTEENEKMHAILDVLQEKDELQRKELE